MSLILDGTGTISGLNAGGLPSATVTQATLATPVAGTGPAFSAYQNNPSQSISASTYTKVTLNTEDFDTANAFDSTTNYRFTPQVAGYYQINGQVTLTNIAAQRTTILIYKNGSAYRSGSAVPTNGLNNVANAISCLVYLNGSTDYIELYVWAGGTTSLTYQSGTTDSCYMNGFLARSA